MFSDSLRRIATVSKGKLLSSVILAAFLIDTFIMYQLVSRYGWGEDALLLFTRYSARLSFVLFLPVFAAKALQVLAPGPLSSLLVMRRRQLGLAFAAAHGFHFAGIVTFFTVQGRWFTQGDIVALLIYAMVLLMALTSNNTSMQRLGRGWKALHKVGMYAIFTGFFATYLGRLSSDMVNLPETDPTFAWIGAYWVLFTLASIAWALRVLAFWKLRLAKGRSTNPV